MKFYNKINIKIIITMLILFVITGAAVSSLTLLNIRSIYENNFTERVLMSNSLMASFIDGDSVKYYVELMRNQDESFKERQAQFFHDRERFFELREKNAPEAEQKALLDSMESFHASMAEFKTEYYWQILTELKKLKEISRSKYVYAIADTGVVAKDGTKLYTYILDAEDSEASSSLDNDGLGSVNTGEDVIPEIYATKKAMDTVMYYSHEVYGELYFAYAPVLDSSGNVVALLGTDIGLDEMNQQISRSMLMFNAFFFGFVIIIILVIYMFLRRSVTGPLDDLTATAQKLAEGDIYASVPPNALEQKSEFGVLAHVIDDMIGVHQRMILNRAILDSNPYICIIFDEKLNIIDCNPRVLEFYRFSSLEALSNGYRDFLKTAIPKNQPNKRESIPFEERIKTAFRDGICEFDVYLDVFGKLTPFNTIVKLIEYNNKPAVVVYQFDLTAQKEIQQSLEYRGSLLQAVSDISDLLLTADTESVDLVFHKAFDILGHASKVDRVYVWNNHMGDDERLYMTQMYEWSLGAEPQQGNEYTVDIPYDEAMPSWRDTLLKGRCLNGLVESFSDAERAQLEPQGIVSLLIVPIFIQNKFWGFIGFDDCHMERVFTKTEENILRACGYMVMAFSDMIQNEVAMNLIKAREEALMTARTKSNFLANMSHEIRTPMNAILGMTELILHEDAGDTVLGHAEDIKNACQGLLVLINDILDISKIESGRLEVVPVRYQLSSLLVDVISIIKMRADKKGITFVTNIDAGLPFELIGDEIRVKQILINLLSNAVKFTHKGHVALSVSGRQSDNGFAIEFSVADTGIGINPDDLERLFESFHQVDTRKNRNIEGAGLGLSISKQLAEMMGGAITVESEYEKGSTFTMVIPQEIASSQPMASLKTTENSVLVYENRKLYISSITFALESLGCHYKVCANQSELHDQLNELDYDYIFAAELYANKTQSLAAQRKCQPVIVALGDSAGQSGLDSGILSISMPIHCLQIAGIMNDENANLRLKHIDSADADNIVAPEAKILVVDDNIVNLKVAAGLLKTYEIQADTAISGARALEMVKSTVYDLIFMDHMMPEMDGIDTTVAIRELGGEYFSKVPIIALTANAISGAREMFKAEGLDDYLSKPIEMSKLSAILVKWIPKAKQQLKASKATEDEAEHLEIPGLDTQKGIMHSGGSLESYMDILTTYTADGERRQKEIEKCYEESDLKLLTTYIHALKSASASIGAVDVSHMAAELESAGKKGDVKYVADNLEPFLSELSRVLSNINCYLDSNVKKSIAPDKSADLSFLAEALERISDGLNNIDIDIIEATLDEIYTYSWDENISISLDKLKACIDFFDYDGAGEALTELKNLGG